MTLQAMLLTHLQNAYAMELKIVEVLKRHKEDAKDLPEVFARIEKHIGESELHAEKVKECVLEMGGELSAVKNTVSSTMGAVEGMLPDMQGEPAITNLKVDYVTEHFEIVCYSVITELAQVLRSEKVMDMCEKIIAEEQEMAEDLMTILPEVISMVVAEKQKSN
jgi:ferritin-like metal-binding protein YciE